MFYIVTEILEDNAQNVIRFNAGGKAREDIRAVLLSENAKEIQVAMNLNGRENYSAAKKTAAHLTAMKKWEEALSVLLRGDVVFIQYPLIFHTVFSRKICRDLKKRGVKTILLIHDLWLIREKDIENSRMTRLRSTLEEMPMLKACSCVIAHNKKMAGILSGMGIDADKIVTLDIFDYLADAQAKERSETRHDVVAVAGNLMRKKAGYVYRLPTGVTWNLYGQNYDGPEKENIHYLGTVDPDELPGKIEGDFGLVWDGELTETCSGAYGQYLKINDPHKASLFLAAGIPILIWKEAALAEFIEENKCGILIKSLDEVKEVTEKLSASEYREMSRNAKRISADLRSGYYTKKAVHYAERYLGNERHE